MLSKYDFVDSYDTFSALKKNIVLRNPQLILIDYDLTGFNGPQSIQEVLVHNKKFKIIVLGPDLPDETEWNLFKAGIKGYCHEKLL